MELGFDFEQLLKGRLCGMLFEFSWLAQLLYCLFDVGLIQLLFGQSEEKSEIELQLAIFVLLHNTFSQQFLAFLPDNLLNFIKPSLLPFSPEDSQQIQLLLRLEELVDANLPVGIDVGSQVAEDGPDWILGISFFLALFLVAGIGRILFVLFGVWLGLIVSSVQLVQFEELGHLFLHEGLWAGV